MITINKKGLLFYYGCLFILVFGILGNRYKDNISKEYYNYPDYPELNNIAVNGDYRNALEAETSYEGLVTSGPDITLPKGSYEIDFRYRSDAEGNHFAVVSDTEVNSENELGCIYAEGGLPLNDDGKYTAQFTLMEGAEHVQIKTYTTSGDLYVYGYTLKSVAPINNDTWAMAVVLLLAFVLFDVLCMKHDRLNEAEAGWFEIIDRERLGAVLAVLLVGIVASLPCLTDFVTRGHDLDYHLTRIDGLAQALRCGQFPVRINPLFANGHGQVNPVMYPELFLYFPAVLRLLGVSLILSYQMLCIGLNLTCAWVGYISFRKLFGSKTLGVLMSAFYTLALYRMNNLYMRAALGEWIGMIFLPLVLYGMYALIYEEKGKWGWSVLAFTLCLQGHLLVTEMAIAFSCLFALLSWKQLKDKTRLFTVIKAGCVTVLVNLWYIVPLLYFYRQAMGISAEQQPLGQYALYPSQLFATFLYNGNLGEYLGSTAGENPTTVGGILGIGILLYLYAAYGKASLSVKERKVGNLLLAFGLLSLYMTTCYFPWALLQKVRILDVLAGILQFPMRILTMATLFLSGTCALGLYGTLKGRMTRKSVALIGVILAIGACSYTLDAYTEENKTALADDTDSYNKNLIYNGLLYFQGTDANALLARKPLVTVSMEEIAIHNYQKQGTTVRFTYENASAVDGFVEVPLYYYPGYKAWNNGVETEISAGDNGIARIHVAGGTEGELLVKYREKGIFVVFDVISLVSLLGVSFIAIRRQKRM